MGMITDFLNRITGADKLIGSLCDEISEYKENQAKAIQELKENALKIEYFEKRCVAAEKERDDLSEEYEKLNDLTVEFKATLEHTEMKLDSMRLQMDKLKADLEAERQEKMEHQLKAMNTAKELSKVLSDLEESKRERFRMRDELAAMKAEHQDQPTETAGTKPADQTPADQNGGHQARRPGPRRKPRPKPYPKED